MSARLVDDMRSRRVKLGERASAYKIAGARELAARAINAAQALALACEALEDFDAAEGEALNQAKEA